MTARKPYQRTSTKAPRITHNDAEGYFITPEQLAYFRDLDQRTRRAERDRERKAGRPRTDMKEGIQAMIFAAAWNPTVTPRAFREIDTSRRIAEQACIGQLDWSDAELGANLGVSRTGARNVRQRLGIKATRTRGAQPAHLRLDPTSSAAAADREGAEGSRVVEAGWAS